MDTLIAFAIVVVFTTFCIYVQLTLDRKLPWRKYALTALIELAVFYGAVMVAFSSLNGGGGRDEL